jgi:hypothetical protein
VLPSRTTPCTDVADPSRVKERIETALEKVENRSTLKTEPNRENARMDNALPKVMCFSTLTGTGKLMDSAIEIVLPNRITARIEIELPIAEKFTTDSPEPTRI